MTRVAGSLAIIGALLLAGCSGERRTRSAYIVRIGDPEAGKVVIRETGCGSCHTIPGIRGANGLVGPPLTSFGRRTFIAGELPNTPENLVKWVKNPVAVEPKTAMPVLGLTDGQAHAVAAYLYTLR
jgi:cytochrome c